MTCCGKEVTTAYCPDCGSPTLPRGPIYELMHHIRLTSARQRNNADLKAKYNKQNPAWITDKDVAHANDNRDKWLRWETALAALIAKESPKP